jgi:hypothetical protein
MMNLDWEVWESLFIFYNRMAADCYASGIGPSLSTDLPISKRFDRSEGKFGYYDQWHTGRNGGLSSSGGHTILTVDLVPVWMLQYWGWHDKSDSGVLEALREALLEGYTTGESRGGRGPGLFTTPGGEYCYQNEIMYGGGLVLPEHFETEPRIKHGKLNFSGFEQIFRKETEKSAIPAYEVFHHDFVGFALKN